MTIAQPPSDAPPNIRRKAAADRHAIYETIRDGLRDGTFGHGEKLPTERELAETFGAGRNSVRKALDRLVSEGLVTREVGRGTFAVRRDGGARDAVAGTTSLQQILEARLLIEPQLVPLVVERAGPEDFAAMEECLDGIRHARTWSAYKEWKYQLHLVIVRAAGNELLTGMFEAIIRARRADQWGGTDPAQQISDEARATTLAANAAIVTALRERRTAEAAEAVRRYLTDTLASLHGV